MIASRFVQLLSATLLAIISTGCASASRRIYEAGPISKSQEWQLGFAYESGANVEKRDNSGGRESTVIRGGKSANDLQLRDNIYFHLKDKYNRSVRRGDGLNAASIKLLPIRYNSGGFKSLDVRFEDSTGAVLARLVVKNSDRNCCYKDDDDFAKFAASKIEDVLRSTAK
jgi:hypothetical protein